MDETEKSKKTKTPSPPASAKPAKRMSSRPGVKVKMVFPGESGYRPEETDKAKEERQSESAESGDGANDGDRAGEGAGRKSEVDDDKKREEGERRQRQQQRLEKGEDESKGDDDLASDDDPASDDDSDDEDETAQLIPTALKRMTLGDEFFTVSDRDCCTLAEEESSGALEEVYAGFREAIGKWKQLSFFMEAGSKVAMDSFESSAEDGESKSDYQTEKSADGLAWAQMVQTIADDAGATFDKILKNLERAGFRLERKENKRETRAIFGDPRAFLREAAKKGMQETMV